VAFTRLLIAFAAVSGLLLIWRELERRVLPSDGVAGLPGVALESALLTLFAGLWFGSLGSGGAVLLFVLVGALMELPARLRLRHSNTLPWKHVLAGILRIVLAGLLLSAVLR
jgi:hypothetical protein